MARPKRRVPKHAAVLDVPYEVWVEVYGETCGICGRPPGPNRRLDRDHDHRTGKGRGLACHRCNRTLRDWVTIGWLVKAIRYLIAAEEHPVDLEAMWLARRPPEGDRDGRSSAAP